MFCKNKFAERIRVLRAIKKVKQHQVAEFLNISRTQISEMENGKITTTIEKLWLLADYFDVTIDYLVGRSDEPKK